MSHNYWAHLLQLPKPMCVEPVLHKSGHHNEKPVHCKEELPPLTATTENLQVAPKTQNSQKNKIAFREKKIEGTIVCDMWKWCKIRSSMSIKKVLLKYSCPWTCLCFICDCFHTTMAEWSRCDRNHMAPKACNIYHLVLYKKLLADFWFRGKHSCKPGSYNLKRQLLNEEKYVIPRGHRGGETTPPGGQEGRLPGGRG